jgi:hypothetical protein
MVPEKDTKAPEKAKEINWKEEEEQQRRVSKKRKTPKLHP